MRSVCIVGDPPCFDDPSSVSVACEEMLVEALIPEATDEALDESVLLRLARLDVMPFDIPVAPPLEDGMAGQFRAVVRDDHAGSATPPDKRVQFAGNTLA